MGKQRGTPRRLVTAAVGKERKDGGEEREGDRVQQAPRPHGRHARRHHRTGPHTHTPGATLRRLVALRFTTIVAAAYTHTPRRYSLSHARRHAPEHAHTPSARVHAWARRRQRGGTVSPPSKRERKKKDVYRELREFRIGVGDPSAHARQHPVAAVQRSTQPDDTRRASPLTQPARSAFLLMPRTAQCGGVGCCSTQTRREKEGGSTRTPAQQRWRQGNLKKKSE